MSDIDWKGIPEEYRNQIVTGDARELAKRIPDESIDLMITDPPYFLPVQTYVGSRESGWVRRTIGDMSVLQTYFDVMFELFCGKIKPTGSAYIFCDGQSYPLMYRSLYPYFKYVRPLIWDKVVSYNGYTWRHQHEIIAWCEGYEAERIPTGDGDVLTYRAVLQKNRKHPAEKPIELISRIINKHEGAHIIFDPYSGSAPVAVSAWHYKRNYVAFEIDPDVAERARGRVQETESSVFAGSSQNMQLFMDKAS